MIVRIEYRPKKAFVYDDGTHQDRRLHIRLCNSPNSFERALAIITNKFKWKTFIIYIDDVIIYWKAVEEQISHVDDTLYCLAEAGVTFKVKKSIFFQRIVEGFGHKIKPVDLEIDRTNTESLRKGKTPTT